MLVMAVWRADEPRGSVRCIGKDSVGVLITVVWRVDQSRAACAGRRSSPWPYPVAFFRPNGVSVTHTQLVYGMVCAGAIMFLWRTGSSLWPYPVAFFRPNGVSVTHTFGVWCAPGR